MAERGEREWKNGGEIEAEVVEVIPESEGLEPLIEHSWSGKWGLSGMGDGAEGQRLVKDGGKDDEPEV